MAEETISSWRRKSSVSSKPAKSKDEGPVTFPFCQQLIDDHTLVPEDEIREAMRLIFDKEHWVIEGSAGFAVAACLKERERYAGQKCLDRPLRAEHRIRETESRSHITFSLVSDGAG
ncbi:MAG: pyridoxal-phosphate dependent enzyme [Blastocatellia bacterium]